MRNLKKFLALVLAMMMTLSLMVTVNASSFSDDDDITTEYGEAVDVLTSLNVIKGYSDGSFLPKEKITRAEVAAIVYRLYTGDVDDDNIHLYKGFSEFSDVAGDKWYTPYVNFCANNGLVNGVGNNRFAPSSYVTGYEALVMILRAIGYNNPSEFSSSDWKFKASGYGSRLGITANVPAGSLGAEATREMVAEIMFQGLLVPTVTYSPLTMYTQNILVEAGTKGTGAHADVVVYSTNVYSTLMYEVFDIVGKKDALTYSAYGRPSYRWVKDHDVDSLSDGSKYVVNENEGTYAFDTRGRDDEKAFDIAMTPLKTYTNSITECNLSKDIANDATISWDDIHEVLNGNAEAASQTALGSTFGTGNTLDNSSVQTGTKANFDALHTSVDYVGATGRTTEIYRIPAGSVGAGDYVFVYIDTFLGEVISTTPAIKDTAGHVIKAAEAVVEVGNEIADDAQTGTGTDKPVKLTLKNPNEKYKTGDLVLIQTAGGAKTLNDQVDSPERAPLDPVDVPDTFAEFVTGSHSSILATAPTTVQVTINATVGTQNRKMGVIGTNGNTYMASNTFLAARDESNDSAANTNKTVLEKWYGVDNDAMGITNSMIGRTYDLVLDHHGYIVGMKEVLTIDSGVGVITGIDTTRISYGKYLTTIEAFMADQTTKTFNVVKLNGAGHNTLPTVDATTTYSYYETATDSDTAWADGGAYGDHIGIGSLVKFKQTKLSDGQTAWIIDDWANPSGDNDDAPDFGDPMNPDTRAGGEAAEGIAAMNLDDAAVTGVTNTLESGTDNKAILDSASVVFVAEYEYRYNTGSGNNDGNNMNKTYKVYNGFKKMPTVTGAAGNVLWQRLQKAENAQYVLVYAADPGDEYVLRAQTKMTVDESYLVLSRGATYAAYSEYNVLKNGTLTTLQVSNANAAGTTGVNNDIENAMIAGDLIVVDGRNAAGYVTAIKTVDSVNDSNRGNWAGLTSTRINGITATATTSVSQKNDVLDITASDGTTHNYLTIADGCKVLIVNLDLKTTTDADLSIAMDYANGVTSKLPRHDLVYELDEFGYVCTLYIID